MRFQLETWLSKKRNTLEFVGFLLALTGLGFTAWQTYIGSSQLKENVAQTKEVIQQAELERKITSANLMLEFYRKLDEPDIRELVKEIYDSTGNNSPLLKESGGKYFTESDIDRVLSIYEIMSIAYQNNLLNNDMVYGAFSDEILEAYNNPDIQKYIKDSRTFDENYYTGFEHLAKEFEQESQ